jgi:hypothetical protein
MQRTYPWLLLFLFLTTGAVLFLNAPGTNDVESLVTWSRILDQHGLGAGYAASGADYPPIGVALVHGAIHSGAAWRLSAELSLKVAILLFLLLTLLLFYLATRDLVLTVLLEAALLLNSVALGYIDVFFAPLLLLMVIALARRQVGWALTFFALACFTKWQVLIIAPFVGLYALRLGGWVQAGAIHWRRMLASTVGAAGITLVLLLVFRAGLVLTERYSSKLSTYLDATA